MLAANDLLTTTLSRADTKVERIPLFFRQLQIEARELRELVVGVGDGSVSVRAVCGATHVGVRATVICDDPAALGGLGDDLRERLLLLADRPSPELARLSIAVEDAPESILLEVEITVPSSVVLALDHANEV